MNSVFAVLCCCYLSCVIGPTVPESTTVLLDKELIFLQEDELETDQHLNETFLKLGPELFLNTSNDINNTKTSLQSLNNKINDSELYENGQTVKENDERSFILINQKFKSLWFDGKRPIVPKTKFRSAEKFKQFDKLLKESSIGLQSAKGNYQPTHADKSHNEISNTYSYKSKSAYFSPVNAVPAQITKEKEYIELSKKPLVRPFSTRNRSNNLKTNSHKAVEKFFRSQDYEVLRYQNYKEDEDSVVPKLAVQNQHYTHNECKHRDPNAILFERFPITYYDKTNVLNDVEDSDRLDHFIRNALKQDTLEDEINNTLYNCYNVSCQGVVNKYNQRTFNGVQHGYSCICDYSNTGDRAGRQDERPVKEEVSTEIKDFEAVLQETERLSNVGEGKVTLRAFD